MARRRKGVLVGLDLGRNVEGGKLKFGRDEWGMSLGVKVGAGGVFNNIVSGEFKGIDWIVFKF